MKRGYGQLLLKYPNAAAAKSRQLRADITRDTNESIFFPVTMIFYFFTIQKDVSSILMLQFM